MFEWKILTLDWFITYLACCKIYEFINKNWNLFLSYIGDKPGTTGSPVLTDPADLSSATRKPADITLPSNPDVNSKEPGFFSKMFGFKFFKPRDE